MSEQIELFARKIIDPVYAKGDDIQTRFEHFDRLNPWVFAAFVRLAEKARDQGRKRIGMKHLVEVVRWHYAGSTKGDEFRLNNSFTSRYVRRIIQLHPELESLFELRELRA